MNINDGLALIEKNIAAYQAARIDKQEMIMQINKIASEFSLSEFQQYLNYNRNPDPEILLGLSWHYSDSYNVV